MALTAPLIRSAPFISQIATFPFVSCNRALPKTPPIGVTLVDELWAYYSPVAIRDPADYKPRMDKGGLRPAELLDSGLCAVSLVAGYYRIAGDTAQLRHQLALTGRRALAEDIVRGANILQLKSRILRGVTARRLGAIPYPAILGLKEGGFAVLGAGSTKGMARLVDPIGRTAQELSIEDIAALSSGELVLITRRLGGAGVDPKTFGFRWFWPSILRYRRPLTHVLVASLFVQLFALATPIFSNSSSTKYWCTKEFRPLSCWSSAWLRSACLRPSCSSCAPIR